MDRSLEGAILVGLREEVGITQKKLAEGLGVSIQTVRNWEHGKAVPRLTIPQTKQLCRLLKKSIEELPDSFGPPGGRSASDHSGDRPQQT